MNARVGTLFLLFIGCLLSGLVATALHAPARVLRSPGDSLWTYIYQTVSINLPAYLLLFLSFAMGITAICQALFFAYRYLSQRRRKIRIE
jgi:hypothetical protein